MLTAMKCFNRFAASSWKLGGFKFSDLEDLKEEKPNEDDSAAESEDERHTSSESPRKPNAENNGSVSLNSCDSFYLDYWGDLKWVKKLVPISNEVVNLEHEKLKAKIKSSLQNIENLNSSVKLESDKSAGSDGKDTAVENSTANNEPKPVDSIPTFADIVAKAFAGNKLPIEEKREPNCDSKTSENEAKPLGSDVTRVPARSSFNVESAEEIEIKRENIDSNCEADLIATDKCDIKNIVRGADPIFDTKSAEQTDEACEEPLGSHIHAASEITQYESIKSEQIIDSKVGLHNYNAIGKFNANKDVAVTGKVSCDRTTAIVNSDSDNDMNPTVGNSAELKLGEAKDEKNATSDSEDDKFIYEDDCYDKYNSKVKNEKTKDQGFSDFCFTSDDDDSSTHHGSKKMSTNRKKGVTTDNKNNKSNKKFSANRKHDASTLKAESISGSEDNTSAEKKPQQYRTESAHSTEALTQAYTSQLVAAFSLVKTTWKKVLTNYQTQSAHKISQQHNY